MAKRLNDEIANASMVDDFSIRQLFDSENSQTKSFEFLKEFIIFKSTLNEMREKSKDFIKRNAEEVKEQERLKEMTDEEINQEIYKIEHDLSAKGNRFINILEFQKRVAKEKGLLDSTEQVEREDLFYKSFNTQDTVKIMKKAKVKGINYLVFPNSTELKGEKNLIIVSKSDKELFNLNEEELPFEFYNSMSSSWRKEENLGVYPVIALNMIKKKLSRFQKNLCIEQVDERYKLSLGYDMEFESLHRYQIDGVMRDLQELDRYLENYLSSEEELKDVLCYISFPANRNIIPILKEMKNNGVTPYIEPAPKKDRNRNNRNMIQIYFRREDLSKFDECYQNIANEGLINVVWGHNASMGKAIKSEIIWPDGSRYI